MKKGFTLAEVLITLGIIGIVAAMTLPTVINDSTERETVAKVKKFYSVMNQALLMAISKHGYVDEWTFCAEKKAECAAQFVENIKPELKLARDCADEINCAGAAEQYKTLDGNDYSVDYKTSSYFYKMILIDGSYLWIRNNYSTTCANSDSGTDNVCGLIWIDTNGSKKPNKLGIDVFIFFIMKDRVIAHPKDDCKKGKTGWGCSAYILQHDNMKYPAN